MNAPARNSAKSRRVGRAENRCASSGVTERIGFSDGGDEPCARHSQVAMRDHPTRGIAEAVAELVRQNAPQHLLDASNHARVRRQPDRVGHLVGVVVADPEDGDAMFIADGVLDLPTETYLQAIDNRSVDAEQQVERNLRSRGRGVAELKPDSPREIFDLSVGEVPRSKVS
jgi:hypothetical protein